MRSSGSLEPTLYALATAAEVIKSERNIRHGCVCLAALSMDEVHKLIAMSPVGLTLSIQKTMLFERMSVS
jgi:diacylglycerol kinase